MQFFLAEVKDGTAYLHADEVRHATKVLRKQPGDDISVIDGAGSLYRCRIERATKSSVQAVVLNESKNFGAFPYELHVAIAPTKNIDRFEWFLEKATEMGVTSIYPILTKHSERKVIKPERLQKILVSATKQSLKGQIPVLHPLLRWTEFLAKPFEGDRFIAHCADGEKRELATAINPQKATLVCVGPEGDFDLDEVNMAQERGFLPVQIGRSRLRTETAGVVSVAAMYNKSRVV